MERITFISKKREVEMSRRNIDIIRSCTNVYKSLIAIVLSQILRFPWLISYMYSKVVHDVIRRIAGRIRSTRRIAVKNVESMINFDHSETSGSNVQKLNPISTP